MSQTDFGSEAGTRQLALPRSAARVLAASANSQELCRELGLCDFLARRLFARLGGELSAFEPRELRATAFRTRVVDQLVRERLADVPHALGVGVWPLLGTRGHRLSSLRWVDVDAPRVADLRRYLLPQRPGLLQLSSCLCNTAWLDAVAGAGSRKLLLVLDESVLPLTAETMMGFLDGVSERASAGTELVVSHDLLAPLRRSASAAIELVLPQPGSVARYPRLRLVDADEYPSELRTRVAGVNAIAELHPGAPGLAHLRVV